jgi:hypothetical protein
MKNARTRKRSTSEKRKRSSSRSKDDDLLIKALNQKVVSDKQILISKEQYEELLATRSSYKELQSKLHSTESSYAKLQEEYNKLLSNNSHSLQGSFISSQPEQQKLIDNLKNSFSDIDQVLKLKSRAGRRYLSTALKSLQEIELAIEPNLKVPKTREVFRRLVTSLQDLMNMFNDSGKNLDHDDDPETENLKLRKEITGLRDKVQGYKESLNRLQEQTKLMKKRMMESSGKRNIEEQESRIEMLEHENEILAQHVKSLQATLTEQCQIIGHLKEAFQAIQVARPENTTPTPKRLDLLMSRNSQDEYLQDEIDTLDLEIQQLQQSLQKALSTN